MSLDLNLVESQINTINLTDSAYYTHIIQTKSQVEKTFTSASVSIH